MSILTILTGGNISQSVLDGFASGVVSVQEISIIAIVIGAIFVNNVVLSQFLGICPSLGVSSKVNTSLGMGMAVTFVMALASIVTWCLQTYILVPFGIEYMQTIVFILVIAALVQMVEIVLKKVSPALYQALGIFLPLITRIYGRGTTFANPINAIARRPAVMSAMGTPRKAAGTSSTSRRSRIPAKRTRARAKPRAVATA